MSVRSGGGDASCVVRADRAVFDKVAAGRMNAVAAVLRGDLQVEGDWRLLVRMQRLFPAGPSAGEKSHRVSDGLVKILDGNTFVVSDARGDIEASLTDPTGLFSFDTRFLSRWVLTVNGERLNPLSVDDLQYFETRFFLVPGTGTVYIDAKLSVIRQRAVSTGFHEELTILNHADKPSNLTVRIEAGCDFADLFEVKDALRRRAAIRPRSSGKLTLGYERGPSAGDRDHVDRTGDFDAEGLTFTVKVPSARRVEHGDRRRHRAPGRGPGLPRARRIRSASRRACGGTSSAGSPTRRASSATGTRSRRRTGGASSTSRRCGSRRRSQVAARFPRRAFRGS